MISYELAKELKDKGFPQPIPEQFALHDERVGGKISFQGKDMEPVYIPTLSELIEACGEGLNTLYEFRGEWEVGKNRHGDIEEPKGIGSSPEEAVARLWLQLQDNKEKK